MVETQTALLTQFNILQHTIIFQNNKFQQQQDCLPRTTFFRYIYISEECYGACWNGWHETKTAYLWPSKLACGFLRVHKGSQGCLLRSIWGSMLGSDRCPSSKSLRSLWLDCTLTKYSPNSSHVTWQSTGCNSVNWKTALVQVWMSGGYVWRRPAESHLEDKQWVKTRPQYKHWHRHTLSSIRIFLSRVSFIKEAMVGKHVQFLVSNYIYSFAAVLAILFVLYCF